MIFVVFTNAFDGQVFKCPWFQVFFVICPGSFVNSPCVVMAFCNMHYLLGICVYISRYVFKACGCGINKYIRSCTADTVCYIIAGRYGNCAFRLDRNAALVCTRFCGGCRYVFNNIFFVLRRNRNRLFAFRSQALPCPGNVKSMARRFIDFYMRSSAYDFNGSAFFCFRSQDYFCKINGRTCFSTCIFFCSFCNYNRSVRIAASCVKCFACRADFTCAWSTNGAYRDLEFCSVCKGDIGIFHVSTACIPFCIPFDFAPAVACDFLFLCIVRSNTAYGGGICFLKAVFISAISAIRYSRCYLCRFFLNSDRCSVAFCYSDIFWSVNFWIFVGVFCTAAIWIRTFYTVIYLAFRHFGNDVIIAVYSIGVAECRPVPGSAACKIMACVFRCFCNG